ncbi:hypothetical protein MMC30_008279, partial [Trapelia coarctata]|nr:hypothetical protein [Trapelia coarctata]
MNNRLLAALPTNQPTVSAARVLAVGATGLASAFPDPRDMQIVLDAYMGGLKAAWIWKIAMAGMAFVVAFAAEWKSLKPEDVKARAEARAAAEVPSA